MHGFRHFSIGTAAATAALAATQGVPLTPANHNAVGPSASAPAGQTKVQVLGENTQNNSILRTNSNGTTPISATKLLVLHSL